MILSLPHILGKDVNEREITYVATFQSGGLSFKITDNYFYRELSFVNSKLKTQGSHRL